MFFFLADTTQTVDNIHRAICFSYSCFSSFQSEINLFRPRTAVNAIFLAHSGKTSQASVPGNSRLIDGIFALKRGCLRIISSNRWYIARIFQISSTPAGNKELAGGCETIRNREIFEMNIKSYYFSRVQITPKMSTNISRYLYSRRPV